MAGAAGGRAAFLTGLTLSLMGCGQGPEAPGHKGWPAASAAPPTYKYKTAIHLPYPQLGMNTAARDAEGKPVRVRCATCHLLQPPQPRNEMATQLAGFHKGVKLVHGGLTCRTCHDPPRYETFRLGSGAAVPYRQVMQLCGQCHSRQRRDYDLGLHGGMAGYWDLDAGPRDRNHCLDCHNPHQPRVPRVIPVPRSRYHEVPPGERGGGDG